MQSRCALLKPKVLPNAIPRFLTGATLIKVPLPTVPFLEPSAPSPPLRTGPVLVTKGCRTFVPTLSLQLTTLTLPPLITTSLLVPCMQVGQTGVTRAINVYTPLADESALPPSNEPELKCVHFTPLLTPNYPPVRQLVPKWFAKCPRLEFLATFLPLRQFKEIQKEDPLPVVSIEKPHLRCRLACTFILL